MLDSEIKTFHNDNGPVLSDRPAFYRNEAYFVPNQGLKSADILCVFQGFQTAELVQKSHQLPQVILLLVALNNGGGHKPLNSVAVR